MLYLEVMDTVLRDSTGERLLPKGTAPPLLSELVERIDEARAGRIAVRLDAQARSGATR